ncbi:MAG: hydroxymethylglutaryl-CoA synthase [Gammaproteobacteria bacterium]
MTSRPVGLSGLSLYLPPYRVDLQQWCDWTGADWDKIRQVVGTGFRLLGPQQSIYTMAANAVLRLIQNYDVDPARVRYLALGTESSTDNSAGAVIIKGMVDDALEGLGLPKLSRNCEVPEFKHACLGGIYGLKNALRFLATDGDDSVAIVVSSDKALYERGSSGEPTQGAGAVAMLLSSDPAIATIDLKHSGTASDYRGVDFRKPLVNRNGTGASPEFVDIPIYNGKYSTSCYVDEMQHALEDMYRKRGLTACEHARGVEAVFMHRPYQRMPETGWGMAYLFALARGGVEEHRELAGYCDEAGIALDDLLAEISPIPDLTRFAVRERISDEIFPTCLAVLKRFRRTDDFEELVRAKLQLGTRGMRELGNLYTAALPAWLAAGLDEARIAGTDLRGKEILLIGYGSGEAADAIPITMEPGWERAAEAIDFSSSLLPIIDLTHDQYLGLRDRTSVSGIKYAPHSEFVIDRVGSEATHKFQDAGIEYYRYIQ